MSSTLVSILFDLQADANLDLLLKGLAQVLGTLYLLRNRVEMCMLYRALKYFPCLVISDLTGSPFDMEGSARDSQRLLHNRPLAFSAAMNGSGTTLIQSLNWSLSVVGE